MVSKNKIFACLAVCLVSVSISQNSGTSLVPVKVHEKFVIENPDIKPQWKVDGEFYTAQYINPVNNMGYMIVYDAAGNVIRRERELENQEYPPGINDFFNAEYPGEGFVVWSSVDSSGQQSFYSRHRSGLLLFDKSGRLLTARKASGKIQRSLSYPVYR